MELIIKNNEVLYINIKCYKVMVPLDKYYVLQ